MRHVAMRLLRREFSSNLKVEGKSGPARRVTLRTLRGKYERGKPITMVTAYDYASGAHVDAAGVDIALVGDSLGMVVLGERTTQSVTLGDIVHHARATRRGVTRAMLVADLPFGSYESGGEQAVRSAVTLIKDAAVDAVKLEGSRAHAVRAIRDAGVAVMGHIGLAPQSYSALGGFRAVGRDATEAAHILDDALAVQDAGAFAIVVECVPAKVAAAVSDALDIPTIGIGAGPGCNGQVLVYHDLLGMSRGGTLPRFAKQYANVGDVIHCALEEFDTEVRERRFPGEVHSGYSIEAEELEKFLVHTKQRRNSKHNTLQKRKEVDDEDVFKLY